MYVGLPTDPPRGAWRLTADLPTPKVWVNQGGGSPPQQPPKLSHWLAAAPVDEVHSATGGGNVPEGVTCTPELPQATEHCHRVHK